MALSRSGRSLALNVAACAGLCVAAAASLAYANRNGALANFAANLKAKSGTGPSSGDDNGIARSDDTTIASSRHSGRRRVELDAGGNGHFFADVEFNGRSAHVMVDTGASMVALTAEDASRAGIRPGSADFTGRANTANGVARFAPVTISRITIGGIEVRNVHAAVMEPGKMDMTLLGMSFLSKLSVSMKSNRLVLEE